jgi:hypothetical protein
MATRLHIINNSSTNTAKPVEVCLLHRAVKASLDDKTHWAKG